jgi:hypothetical protein
MDNIAEGFDRDGKREFIQFLCLLRPHVLKFNLNSTVPWIVGI